MGGLCPHYKKVELFQEEKRNQYICQTKKVVIHIHFGFGYTLLAYFIGVEGLY
ncbi:hypothetical protein [Neobacillus sp. 114]|uniref:hypothetical protein n=1 Tax=Neobacillus sp. 114 TaxID=3048535 RepID=UPI0024C423B2|nr:hypothetical protein [Neobacillus sp. 114]